MTLLLSNTGELSGFCLFDVCYSDIFATIGFSVCYACFFKASGDWEALLVLMAKLYKKDQV